MSLTLSLSSESPSPHSQDLLFLSLHIDRYDENLYEVLAPYVLDEEGSWEAMQEFIHDRREQW